MTDRSQPQRGLRQRPAGWPVGSFSTYAEAQSAVDRLADEKFPVEQISIVGVDLVEVEKVTGRLTWGKALGSGALSGAWIGIFFGLLFGILGGPLFSALIWGIIIGAIFGLIFAAVPYGMSGGERDFTSHTQIVAGRYDVICAPQHATEARDMIARMGVGLRHSPQENPSVAPGQPAPGTQQQDQQPAPRQQQAPDTPGSSPASGSSQASGQRPNPYEQQTPPQRDPRRPDDDQER